MLIAEYKFNNKTDLLPIFNEGFTYTYKDIIEDNITHRLLYAYTLPESISFAGSLSLIECGYLDASAATKLDATFNNCTNLERIDFSHAKISDNCVISNFLNNCTSLKSIKISSNSLSVIQKLISQLPSDNPGTFTVIGANSILSELKELSSTTNWEIVPIGPKLCELKAGNKSAYIMSGGSKMSCIIVGKLKFKD